MILFGDESSGCHSTSSSDFHCTHSLCLYCLLCYSCRERRPYCTEASHTISPFLTRHYPLCSSFPLSPGSLGRELVVLHLVLQRNQGSDGIEQRKAFGLIYHQFQVTDQDRQVHGSKGQSRDI